MKWDDLVGPLLSAILGGGVVTGIVSFRKLKPESDQIVVSSAKDVVIIQKGVIDDLRKSSAEDRVRIIELEGKFQAQIDRAEQARWTAETALAECHRAREVLQKQYDNERRINQELTERVEHLESEVARLMQEKG